MCEATVLHMVKHSCNEITFDTYALLRISTQFTDTSRVESALYFSETLLICQSQAAVQNISRDIAHSSHTRSHKLSDLYPSHRRHGRYKSIHLHHDRMCCINLHCGHRHRRQNDYQHRDAETNPAMRDRLVRGPHLQS